MSLVCSGRAPSMPARDLSPVATCLLSASPDLAIRPKTVNRILKPMSPERRGVAFSTHPKVTRRGRGLDSSLREERICATARSDPGSETASFTAALTPTLRPRRPSLVRARSVIALPPGGRIRPACHRVWCRGDLTSDTLAGAQRSTALDAGPKAFVVQRRPFGMPPWPGLLAVAGSSLCAGLNALVECAAWCLLVGCNKADVEGRAFHPPPPEGGSVSGVRTLADSRRAPPSRGR